MACQPIDQRAVAAHLCVRDCVAAESWFATLKTELVYRIVLATKTDARRRIITWIERCNRVRRHSHCGLKSPIDFEKITPPAAATA
jgi:transposase InsO family protein